MPGLPVPCMRGCEWLSGRVSCLRYTTIATAENRLPGLSGLSGGYFFVRVLPPSEEEKPPSELPEYSILPIFEQKLASFYWVRFGKK